MPRAKSGLTGGVLISNAKALSIAQKEKFVRLGASAWLRKEIDNAVISPLRFFCEQHGPQQSINVRVTAEQKEKYNQLGGVHWLRCRLEKE